MRIPESPEVLIEDLVRTYADLESRLFNISASDTDEETATVTRLASLLARVRRPEAHLEGYLISARVNGGYTYPQAQPISRSDLFVRLRQLSGLHLIEGYALQQRLIPSAHYHLAVYYNTLARIADKIEVRDPCQVFGRRHLQHALADAQLTDQAVDDPGLDLLIPARTLHP